MLRWDDGECVMRCWGHPLRPRFARSRPLTLREGDVQAVVFVSLDTRLRGYDGGLLRFPIVNEGDAAIAIV